MYLPRTRPTNHSLSVHIRQNRTPASPYGAQGTPTQVPTPPSNAVTRPRRQAGRYEGKYLAPFGRPPADADSCLNRIGLPLHKFHSLTGTSSRPTASHHSFLGLDHLTRIRRRSLTQALVFLVPAFRWLFAGRNSASACWSLGF